MLVVPTERGAFRAIPTQEYGTRDYVKQRCWPHCLRPCRRTSSLVLPNATRRRCKGSWVQADPACEVLSDNQAAGKSEGKPFSIQGSLSYHM